MSRSPSKSKTSPYDLSYGFYAVMGGFKADIEEFSDTTETDALSSAAILSLAREGFFCQIDQAIIQNKSKASNLAKILTIFQVS